jgi:hypothetical protein
MEVAARAWYDKALRKVNSSLQDQELVKLDHTLLSVLLLALYEVCHTSHALFPRRPEAYLSVLDEHLPHAEVDEILAEPHQRSHGAVRSAWREAA